MAPINVANPITLPSSPDNDGPCGVDVEGSGDVLLKNSGVGSSAGVGFGSSVGVGSGSDVSAGVGSFVGSSSFLVHAMVNCSIGTSVALAHSCIV